MEEKNSRLGWPVWLGLVIGLLVLYPLSFGPVFWVLSRIASHDSPAFTTAVHFYMPLVDALIECPKSIKRPAAWYLGIGASKDVSIHFFDHVRVIDGVGVYVYGLLSSHPGYSYTWLSRKKSLPTPAP